MEPQLLEMVDPTKLQGGEKVIIKGDYRFENQQGIVIGCKPDNVIEVRLNGKEYSVTILHYFVFHDPEVETNEGNPVLVKLDKVVDHLNYLSMVDTAKTVNLYFSKPENQYHPKEETVSSESLMQAVSEDWISEVGDIVALSDGKQFPIDRIYDYRLETNASLSKSIKSAPYVVDRARWKKKELKLVKKVDKKVAATTTDFFPKDKPFDLITARELYKQGGAAQELALKFYYVGELKVPELPMSWEELPRITG